MLPDVAVGQDPAQIQQQPALWTEVHVEVPAVGPVHVEQQGGPLQTPCSHGVEQSHWDPGAVLEM